VEHPPVKSLILAPFTRRQVRAFVFFFLAEVFGPHDLCFDILHPLEVSSGMSNQLPRNFLQPGHRLACPEPGKADPANCTALANVNPEGILPALPGVVQ
jgi:hypothetical protein